MFSTLRFSRRSIQTACSCLLWISIACGVLWQCSSSILAAENADKVRAADDLVGQAMRQEMIGQDGDRNALLKSAIEALPTHDAARWHAGFVRLGKTWVRVDDVPKLLSEVLTQYTKMREKCPATVAGQLQLADWCGGQGLVDEERAHLTKVLELERDHAKARARLGFRQLNGQWQSNDEIKAADERAHREAKARAQWRGELERIRAGLSHRSEINRKLAATWLLSIDDPGAISAMESFLSGASEPAALLVVQWLDAMQNYEASMSLARHSVLGGSERVRQTAAKALESRPVEQYAPGLLAAMYTPIQSHMEIYRGRGGRVTYRHSLLREGQYQFEREVVDTVFSQTLTLDYDFARDSHRRAASELKRIRGRERDVAKQNARSKARNTRICEALTVATGEKLPPTPASWWQWWTDYNELYVSGQKPTKQTYRRRAVLIANSLVGPPRPPRDTDDAGGCCLAAGTCVWTAAGPMPIEKIRVGDRVLSQQPDTGELVYKPVLATTVRPAGLLVKIEAHDATDVIETSSGHLFWISGQGWVRAGHLKPGSRMHGVTGTARVDAVSKGSIAKTYNLIVADFHTYFIGAAKVLCHDNTLRRQTNAVVPGYVAK